MPTFGPHETAARIFLSGVGGVYALKSDEKKVVKVLQPPQGVWSEERIHEEIDAFRLRAKTQRALAKTAKHWAPVHEIAALRQGTEAPSGGGDVIEHPSTIGDPYAQRPVASGAYMVMDRYDRSVQDLISGRVNLLNADLRVLVTGIMKGLLEIEKTGRPHGALTPTNVLLAHSTDLAAATVHLTDPAADGSLNKTSHDADLGNVARMIYELVNHRPYEEGTIAPSRDWDAIGPNGEDWRKLCIALLDPHAAPEERDLEKLLPRIDKWRLKPKVSKKPIFAAAAAIILIVGSIVTYKVMHPKVVYDAGRWQALNLEYHAWFGDFVRPLYKPKTLADFRVSRDYPPDLVPLFDKYKDFVRFDPEQIDNNYDAANWSKRLTDNNGDNQLARYSDNPKYTQQGLELIDAVSKSISPERWTAIKAFGESADRLEKEPYKLVKPAAGIRRTIAELQPPEILNPKLPLEDAVKEYAKIPLDERIKKAEELRKERTKSVFDGIAAVAVESRKARGIENHFLALEKSVKTLPGTAGVEKPGQIPLLSGLQKFIDGYPATVATEDLASLDAPMTQMDEMLVQLAAAFPADRQVDFDELLTDDAAKAPPSIDNYNAFALATKNYWNMPRDPRDATAWTQKLGTINEMIGLIKESAAANDALLPGINREYGDLGDFIKTTGGLKPIVKNEKIIGDNSTAVAARLDKLQNQANEHPAYMNQNKFDTYVALQRSKSADAGKIPPTIAAVAAPVKAKWLEAQNALVAVVSKRTLAEFRKTHVADEKKFAELEAFYADLNTTIPENDAARAKLTTAFAAGPDWAKALAARVAAESRDLGLADLLRNAVKQPDNPPAIGDAGYKSMRDASLKNYQTICFDTQTLIADHLTIDTRLNHLQTDKAQPWRKLYETWPDGKNPLIAEPGITAIRRRVAALLGVEAESDYAKIRDASISDTPEIALTAWRQLGKAVIAEGTPYLTDEQNAEKKLATHLVKLKDTDAPQAQTLTAEVEGDKKNRWQRWSDLAVSGDNINLALVNARLFNIDITKQGQPAMFYYQELLKLKEQYAKTPKEADLKAPAQAFIDLMADPALADVSKTPTVTSLLQIMKKSLSTEQEASISGKQGPQFADWDMEQPNQDVRIFRSKDKKFTLEFRRMQVDENSLITADQKIAPQKTIFLCTTEMSVGIFVQVMNSIGKIDQVDNSKATASHWFEVPAGSYYNSGPRAWTIANGEFKIGDRWIDENNEPTLMGKRYYPAGAEAPDPDADSPMQAISPWAAVYAARLLGCRLPTSDEWLKAYAEYETPKSGSPLPKDVWNLRGEPVPGAKASWTSQFTFADTWNPQGVMPYPDAGIYVNLTTTAVKPASKTNAKTWMAADLAKLAPQRINTGTGAYNHSSLWFEPVNKEIIPAASAGAPPLIMHHLVGNVAEFVYDTEEINQPILNNTPTTQAIDDSLRKPANKISVIGGSSLSPPELPFNEKLPVSPNWIPPRRGYGDVGFRLAYTAPKETIVEVLAKAFRDPAVLPGPRAAK